MVLWSPLADLASLCVIVRTDDDAHDVDDLPDEETSGSDELYDAGNDLAGVEAVQSAQPDYKDEAGEDERYCSGSRRSECRHNRILAPPRTGREKIEIIARRTRRGRGWTGFQRTCTTRAMCTTRRGRGGWILS